jgi:hypothetical protein
VASAAAVAAIMALRKVRNFRTFGQRDAGVVVMVVNQTYGSSHCRTRAALFELRRPRLEGVTLVPLRDAPTTYPLWSYCTSIVTPLRVNRLLDELSIVADQPFCWLTRRSWSG